MTHLKHPVKSSEYNSKKYLQRFDYLSKLVNSLDNKELTENSINVINSNINDLNNFSGDEKEATKHLRCTSNSILNHVKKENGLVPKKYNTTLWMSLGMASFGIPIGLIFSQVLDSLAFLGLGLPLGMAFGLALGAAMDKKAAEQGKQLDIEASI